ncbi:uncharacterized protein I303_106199 [Kwoniella dejecticola CBS 10117]|uniref:Mitochondrial import receptor subunit TOM20 n=1 Tax=Kwoniella dejecticola CBS 10117 TaxID=1296121 RepID=A0A1A6A1J0_9TREE|nr:uncharacterized protein I303_06217 [Kwoniella dejecticola CBS 10117]OBR83931.1 hypothetical protein I303_06217 [Kwoniella dejecticola CBS 10117]
MSASTPIRIAGATAAVAVTGFLGYAVYFDYMRRHSAEFRKGLKKQHKKLAVAAEAQSKAEKERNSKLLREALITIQNEAPPTTPEQQEAYFQEQVAEGEKLATMGPDYQVQSASHFYRALRVYPQPLELLGIYQRVVPPPVWALLIELTSLSGASAASGPGAGAIPPPAQASVADIDDASPVSGDAPSPNSASQGSGTEWEKLSEPAE